MLHFLLKWFFSPLENNIGIWIFLIIFRIGIVEGFSLMYLSPFAIKWISSLFCFIGEIIGSRFGCFVLLDSKIPPLEIIAFSWKLLFLFTWMWTLFLWIVAVTTYSIFGTHLRFIWFGCLCIWFDDLLYHPWK